MFRLIKLFLPHGLGTRAIITLALVGTLAILTANAVRKLEGEQAAKVAGELVTTLTMAVGVSVGFFMRDRSINGEKPSSEDPKPPVGG